MLPRVAEVAVEIKGLRKNYGTLEAVAGVDLSVFTGEVFAVLGPNGAGKTTMIEILEGYRERTSGDVTVLGHDPSRNERAFKERIGIVLQQTGLDPLLTVGETVDMYRTYYPHPRPRDEVLGLVGLTGVDGVKVTKLSGGQKRRLDVAVGLAGDPDLFFLDEPTTGFDPSARRHAWEMIHNLKSLGKTVMLTTHYMDEAQNLADRVAIISAGVILAEGPPSTLGSGAEAGTVITFRLPESIRLPESLAKGAKERDGLVEMQPAHPVRTLNELTGWALEGDIELGALRVARPSLEDVYLELTDRDSPDE
jgi:ABC-2 type transport system ATP-binding protein